MKRRSLYLTAPRQLTWLTEELPPLQSNEVLVQTIAGAISIGTELPQYRGTARSSRPSTYPHMTGYESLETIIACGANVKHLRVGDRVVAFYGHRTHAIVPAHKIIPVPNDISDPLALLTILSCDVTKGIRKVTPTSNDSVLITGCGTIGLLTGFMLHTLGVQNIDVIELRAERRKLALQLGARAAYSLDELPSGNT